MKTWNQKEKDFLVKNAPIKGVKYCSEYLQRSQASIYWQIKNLGIEKAKIFKRSIDFSKIKTPEFAYVLGFLWADGTVKKVGQGVGMGIQARDGNEIFQLCSSFGNWSFSTFTKVTQLGKEKSYASIFVHDKYFHDFLTEHGYRQKSFRFSSTILEFLGNELVPFFVKGLFDGDGCVLVTKNQISLRICGSIDYDWTNLSSYIENNFNIRFKIQKQFKEDKGSSSRLVLCSNLEILKFYKFFVFATNIGLNRKNSLFNKGVVQIQKSIENRKFYQKLGRRYKCSIYAEDKVVFLGTFYSAQDATERGWAEHKKRQTKIGQIFNLLCETEGCEPSVSHALR